MTDEEYQRERNRLKQIRHRKRAKALAEGLDEDYYITEDDYIDRDAALMSEQETREQAGEDESEQGTGAGGWLFVGGCIALLFLYLAYLRFNGNRE